MNFLACALLSAFLTGFAPQRQLANVIFNINDCKGTIQNYAAFSTEYFYQSNSLDFGLGFLCAENQFDLTTSAVIFPLQFSKCKIGVENRFHFKTEKDTFNEYDFLVGLNFEWTPAKWININPSLLYFLSSSEIIPLKPYGNQWIFNNSVMLSLKIKFIPTDFFDFYFAASGSEYFYYNLFGSAHFSFGTDFFISLSKNSSSRLKLFLGADVTSRWVDILTLASRYNGTEVKIKAGICW